MDPSMLVFGGFLLIWLTAVITGMAYLRGGSDAVRRVLPRVAIIIPIVAVVLIVESVVMSKVGSLAVALVLVPIVLARMVLRIRRDRHLGAMVPADASGPMAFTPQIRNFAIVAIVVMLVGSILLAFLASRAGL